LQMFFFLQASLWNFNQFLFTPMSATCHTHTHALYLIVIIFGERYNLWSSSLHSFVQTHLPSSLWGTNILLSTLFSDILKSMWAYIRPSHAQALLLNKTFKSFSNITQY
jgi:hypothetical protein